MFEKYGDAVCSFPRYHLYVRLHNNLTPGEEHRQRVILLSSRRSVVLISNAKYGLDPTRPERLNVALSLKHDENGALVV